MPIFKMHAMWTMIETMIFRFLFPSMRNLPEPEASYSISTAVLFTHKPMPRSDTAKTINGTPRKRKTRPQRKSMQSKDKNASP